MTSGSDRLSASILPTLLYVSGKEGKSDGSKAKSGRCDRWRLAQASRGFPAQGLPPTQSHQGLPQWPSKVAGAVEGDSSGLGSGPVNESMASVPHREGPELLSSSELSLSSRPPAA